MTVPDRSSRPSGDKRAAAGKAAPSRKASREERRQQFIDATIATIAKRGYARTTLTDVAKAAGLSHGLVIFHFQNKEKLLTETLLFLSAEYRDNWVSALEATPDNPAAQLEAMIRADFNDVVFSPERLAAWSAFWGESQVRPLYQKECGANDLEYARKIEDLCRKLNDEGDYRLDPALAGKALRVILEGLWLDLMTSAGKADRPHAVKTAIYCAKAFFPRHFDDDGAIGRLTSSA